MNGLAVNSVDQQDHFEFIAQGVEIKNSAGFEAAGTPGQVSGKRVMKLEGIEIDNCPGFRFANFHPRESFETYDTD